MGENVNLKVKGGTEFSINIFERPSTGYISHIEFVSNPSLVKVLDSQFYLDKPLFLNNYIGRGGIRKFRFFSEHVGIDTIRIYKTRFDHSNSSLDYNHSDFFVTIY